MVASTMLRTSVTGATRRQFRDDCGTTKSLHSAENTARNRTDGTAICRIGGILYSKRLRRSGGFQKRPRESAGNVRWVMCEAGSRMAMEGSQSYGVLRLVAVGDCNTCGISVPAAGRTILQKTAEGLARTGVRCSLQDLGQGMATSREGVARMTRDALPADVGLVNFGLVDSWVTSIPGIYIPYFPDNWVRKWSRKILKSIKRRLRADRIRRYVPFGPVVPLQEYETNIRSIMARLWCLNPSAVIVLWGTAPVQSNETRNSNIQRYNERLRSIARDSNCIYIDTVAVLESIKNVDLYVDEVHFAEAATTAIGSVIADAVASRLFCQAAVAA